MDWDRIEEIIQERDLRFELTFHKGRWHAIFKERVFNEGMAFGTGDTVDIAVKTLLRVSSHGR